METTETPTAEDQTPTPDPTRKLKEPSMTRIDERISNLRPFQHPVTLDRNWVESTFEVTQTASRNIGQAHLTIMERADKAAEKVVADFEANVDLSLLDTHSAKRLTDDAISRANEASRTEKAKQEEIFANVNKINEERLTAAFDQIDGILNIAPNPAALLDITAPPSEERERYARMLRDASYPSLTSWAAWALSTGNRACSAAVCNELASRKRSDRPLDANDFADRIVGDQFRRMVNLRDEIANWRRNVADQKLKLMRGGKGTSFGKIEAALRAKALQAQRDELEDDGE